MNVPTNMDHNNDITVPKFKEIHSSLPVPPRCARTLSSPVGQVGKKWGRGWHAGTDFTVPIGTPVYAAWNGTVVYASNTKKEEGLLIKISSIDSDYGRFEHLYAHLDRFYVEVGDYVVRGRLIGLSGMSGNSKMDDEQSYHLHFQVQRKKDDDENMEILKPIFPLGFDMTDWSHFSINK